MSRARLPPGSAALPALAALLAFGDFVRVALPVRPQIDDAFISYRYAANWVAGHGLVWNVGEYVEGFTNPLWTCLVAIGMTLGADAPTLGWALGFGAAIAALAATVALSRALCPEDWRGLGWLAVVPVASAVSFLYWTTAGLETALVVAASTAALAFHARGQATAMLVSLIIAVATRLDAGLLAAVLLGWPVLTGLADGSWRTLRPWRPIAIYAAAIGLMTLARLAYYGTPLPNTFYAKVGDVPLEIGWLYVSAFPKTGVGLLLPLAVLAAARDRRAWPALVYGVLLVGYVVRVGGDALPHGRFLIATLPILSALGAAGLGHAFAIDRRLGFALLPIFPLVWSWQVFGGVPLPVGVAFGVAGVAAGLLAWLRPARLGAGTSAACGVVGLLSGIALAGGPAAALAGWEASDREQKLERAWLWAERGERLQRRRARLLLQGDPPTLVAAGGIGALGFYSGLPVLDILGLTDAHIARSVADARVDQLTLPGHSRSNAGYVLSRRPDYLFIAQRGREVAGLSGVIPAVQDLWAHPDLERSYVWDEVLLGYRLRTLPQIVPDERSARQSSDSR